MSLNMTVGDHELLEDLHDNGLDTFVKHEGPYYWKTKLKT
jgi:hypothetical protein